MKINPDGTIDLEPGKDVVTVGQKINYNGKNRWNKQKKYSSQFAMATNPPGKGIIGKILGGLKRLGGFALSFAGSLGLELSWSSLWQFLQLSSYTVYNFNWAQSDDELRKQIESTNNVMANLAGTLFGDVTTRIVTVAVVNGIPIRYPIVPARIALEIAKERIAAIKADALEDTRRNIENQFKFGIVLVGQLGLQQLFYQSMLTLRSLKMFGLSPIKQSGEAWSFAKKVDERVESIPPGVLREFVRGYLGGIENAFWDVGYIVTMGLDDLWAMNNLQEEIRQGPTKAVRINPDP